MELNIKKGIAVAGAALALGAGGLTADVALDTQKTIDALPIHEKLVVTKEKIASTTEYILNGKEVVKYSYNGEEVLPQENEIVSERTDKTRVFSGTKENERIMRVYSRGSFIQEDGKWFNVDAATTTKEAFDLQTKSVTEQVIDKMVNLIEPLLPQKAEASSQTVYETKDTYYGTSYATDGCPDCTTIYNGGWGDFYYGHVEWDLTGTPTSAQTSLAQTCFKVETLANYWAQMSIYRITSSWTEAGVTLASNPTYTTDGAVTMTTATADETYYCTNITTLYEGWKDSTYDNYGIRLHSAYNGDSRGAYYSEDQTGTDSDPYLQITYMADNCDIDSGTDDWNANLGDNCYITKYIKKDGYLACFGTGSFTVGNGGVVNVGASDCPVQVKDGGKFVVQPIRMLEQQISLYYIAWRMPDQYHGYGQTFQATSTAPLDWIYAYIRKTGTPTGNVYIKIYNMTGVTSGLGSNIATITLDAATQIAAGSAYYTLSFTGDQRPKLIYGNYYLWTIEFSGTGDVNNYITTGMSQTNVQANNNMYLKSTLDAWSYSTNYDLTYKLWGKFFVQ
jgi:hypothetical protein